VCPPLRLATQFVTPTLLAVNATLHGSSALHHGYDRMAAGVIAGLYGVGVPVAIWYDAQPWTEERALHHPLLVAEDLHVVEAGVGGARDEGLLHSTARGASIASWHVP
jgi:hypothetical protein